MNEYLNVYVYVDLLTVIALAVLSIFALIRGGWRRSENRLFSLFSLTVGIWIIANHISNDVDFSPTTSLIANWIVFPASFATGILLILFFAHFVTGSRVDRLLRYVTIPLWLVCVVSATPLVVDGVTRQGSVYAVQFGPLISLYGFAVIFLVVMLLYLAIVGTKRLHGAARSQLRLISLGLCVSAPLVALFSFIIPALTGNFSVTEFGLIPLLLLVFAMYYSAIRHRLFDIKVAAVRTSVYVLSLATLGIAYYFLAYIISVTVLHGKISDSISVSPFNVVLALVLAFIFQPIKSFFDRVTNGIFYRDRYNAEEFFGILSNVLGTTTDLKGLLESAAATIATTLKSEQAFFYVRLGSNKDVIAGTKGHARLLTSEAAHIDEYSAHKGYKIIVTEDSVSRRGVYAILNRHKIALLLPLLHEAKIIGYLALGEGLGGPYYKRDLRVLETIADELVIAIQNAQAVEEVREVNANLQERIDGATRDLRSKNEKLKQLDDTKDEFISMASHQLRTPLTSVKGYISMILDGDAGPVNDQQRKFLTEAFESSNRMAGIIGDFLNVSRLQTGKFNLEREAVHLGDIIENEVEHLLNTASVRGLALRFHKPAHFPVMQLDKSKIEQVVMNFIDNAIFYAPNTGAVDIELFQRAGRAVFTVRDHGIGVPKSEQASLFTKFFRATNARQKRPDGTGVGLFLAKKVIVAHKGAIIFDSEEGKGSTFGFEIPLTAGE